MSVKVLVEVQNWGEGPDGKLYDVSDTSVAVDYVKMALDSFDKMRVSGYKVRAFTEKLNLKDIKESVRKIETEVFTLYQTIHALGNQRNDGSGTEQTHGEICSWCADTAYVEIQIEKGAVYCARCGCKLSPC